MRASRCASAGTIMAAVLVLGLAGAGDDSDFGFIRPTMIALDFRDRPLAEVFKAISERSGQRITGETPFTKLTGQVDRLAFEQDRSWLERRVTLEFPQTGTFWEAIDRLAQAGSLPYRIAEKPIQGGHCGLRVNALPRSEESRGRRSLARFDRGQKPSLDSFGT